MGRNYAGQDHRNANFRNQNLSGANFRGANLEGADFSGANLRGARFDSIGNRSPASSGESAAFQTLMEKHGITPENITGMEKKGGDVMLTVEVPANANKAQIEADFHGSYQRQLEASQARIAQLEAEKSDLATRLDKKQEEIISELRQSKRDLMELADKQTHNLGHLFAHVTVVAGTGNTLDSPSIEAKEGSVVNTGELNLDDSTLNTGTIERLS